MVLALSLSVSTYLLGNTQEIGNIWKAHPEYNQYEKLKSM
jgi:hypothetical protein